MKKRRAISLIFTIVITFLIIIGFSVIVYRGCALMLFKKTYPDDLLNIAYYRLKIFREIAIWALSVWVILFSLYFLWKRYNKKALITFIILNIIGIICLILEFIFFGKLNWFGFYFSFACHVLVAAIILVIGLLSLAKKK